MGILSDPLHSKQFQGILRNSKDFQGIPTINHDTQMIAADSNGYQRVPMMPESTDYQVIGLASIHWYK